MHMRCASLILAALLGALGAGCSDSKPDTTPRSPADVISPTEAASPTSMPITITAQDTCGPTDGPAVSVHIEETGAFSRQAELVLDGEVVAVSNSVNSTSDSLLIEVPIDPVVSRENDILTGLDITGALVRVTDVDSGTILAVTRSIAPYEGGGCG